MRIVGKLGFAVLKNLPDSTGVLRLRPGVRVQSQSDFVVLSDGVEILVLSEFVMRNLFPAICEGFTLAQLEQRLEEKQTRAQTRYAVRQLELQGWLDSFSLELPSPGAAFWAKVANRKPEPASLGWTAVGVPRKAEQAFAKAWSQLAQLDDCSAWLQPDSNKSASALAKKLNVVLVGDYRHPDLEKIAQQPGFWLPIRPWGNKLWIGPLVGGERSVQWSRLQVLLQRIYPGGTWISLQGNPSQAFRGHEIFTPSSLRLAIQQAWLQLERWCCNPSYLEEHLLSFDLHDSSTIPTKIVDYLFKSAPAETKSIEISINRVPKASPGAERSLSPVAVHQSVWPYTWGVLAEANVRLQESTRVGMPVVCSTSLNPVHKELRHFSHLRHSEMGRHPRLSRAELGAVAETLERISGRMDRNDLVIKSTYAELGERAVHPDVVYAFSQAQRDGKSHLTFDFETPYKLLPPDEPIFWSPGWSLTHREVRYLPSHYVYYQATPVLNEPSQYCDADSNGCASGGCLEEAIRYGLLELIERDAVGVWWYNRLRRPALDLSTFSPECQAFAATIRTGGNELWVLDVTHDLGVPAVVAVYRRQNGECEDPMVGMGCHPDPNQAVLSALSELVQIGCVWEHTCKHEDGQWVLHQLGVKRREDGGMDFLAYEWAKSHTTESDPYLLPDYDEPLRTLSDFPAYVPQESFAEDVGYLQDKIEKAGMEVIVFDQSRNEYPLKAARVVVPGLTIFWPRLGNRRLYEVPVRMGWLPQEHREDQLNPFPFFL